MSQPELIMGTGAANGGDWSRSTPPNAQIVYKIGIYGWRKRCLYVFLLLLMITVIVNLALTIWILKVMDFSIHGMGKLRIVEKGIRVEGDSEFIKSLSAKQIKSRSNSGLVLESSRNITINARDKEGKISNSLYIGDGKLESYARAFQVRNPAGDLLFSADENEVKLGLGADRMKITGTGGAIFKGSVQTPLVRSDSDHLRLESPTRSLFVTGPDGVHLRANAGGITINSLIGLKLQSTKEAIHLDAKAIFMKNIKISTPKFDGKPYPEVFQLCVCGQSGKIFLSPSQGNCQATSDIC